MCTFVIVMKPFRNLYLIKHLTFFMLLPSMSYQLFAQNECGGYWGDPLVNISFGAGSNPGPALAAATSVYTYTTSDCPGDGSYTVRNKSESCFYNDWHTVQQDHTGDKDGCFLLLNTSFVPNDFYLDTVRELCAATTYQFAAWVLNIVTPAICDSNGVKPNINFRVEKTDGTVLYSFYTRDIEPNSLPTWKQYGFTFSSSEHNVVLRMSNVNAGGCGGDFAIDDITLRPCMAHVTIQLLDPDNLPENTGYRCKNTDTSLTFYSSFDAVYTNPAHVWQVSSDSAKTWLTIPGANASVFTQHFTAGEENALYLYRFLVGAKSNVAVPACLVQSNVDSVQLVTTPVVNAGADKNMVRGGYVQLEGSVDATAIQQYWTPTVFVADASLLLATVNPVESTLFTLHAVSVYGCGVATDDALVTVVAPPDIPNAFSPNHDGINDTWVIKDLAAFPSVEVTVFNRYGQKVFVSKGYGVPWNGLYNGRSLPTGTYYYIIDLKTKAPVWNGAVTILK